MLIKYTVEKTIRQSVVDSENNKAFVNFVAENCVKFDKAKKDNYLSLLEKTMYDGVSGTREHITTTGLKT